MKVTFESCCELFRPELYIKLLEVSFKSGKDFCSFLVGIELPVFSKAENDRIGRCIIYEHSTDKSRRSWKPRFEKVQLRIS